MTMTSKILLDTDIGSDIDDAVCLAYLLSQPDCELLGITTVSGESHLRACLASVLCRAAGREIPIYVGVEEPLLVKQRQPVAQQAARLNRWPHEKNFPEIPALQFMAETILSNPGEVTLLAIGPLTNIALLFSVYPETVHALKALVMMCGVFTDQRDNPWKEEWNALLDPHAAEIVYRAPVIDHRSIGLDVTRQVRLSAEQVKQRFDHPILIPVLDFADVWFEEQKEMIFHDPLAGVSIFEPDICSYVRGRVSANSDASSGPLGATHFMSDTLNGPHSIATSVDVNVFFDEFFQVFDE